MLGSSNSLCGFSRTQIPLMLETLAKLVNADKLRIDYTEYELCDEFKEALEHAQVRAFVAYFLALDPPLTRIPVGQETGRNTKVLLKVTDIGVTYE